MTRALLLAALFLPVTAWAQYAGPAVEACRIFADQEQKDPARKAAVVIEKDRHLVLDRYTRKVGTQFVSSVLYGNASFVLTSGPAVEINFICLLADEKRAVYFGWTPRMDSSAFTQCSRANAAQAQGCVDVMAQITEQDLTQAYATRFQEARDADGKAGNENASNAIRRSNQAWLAYRDAECGRRASPEARKGCVVDLNRRRLLDVR
jgi:uncharacterized protein YecT (DUF1311 family)